MPTTRYIATAGNDSTGAGTQVAPYKTFSKALAVSSSGDTILANGGDTFRESVTSTLLVLNLGSWGTGRATVTGADVVTGWGAAGVGTNTYSKAMSTQTFAVFANGARQVVGASSSTLNNGEWFWVSNVVYYRSDAGNPDSLGLLMEAAQRNYVIFSGTNGTTWSVDNLVVTQANQRLINIANGTGWKVTRNVLSYNTASVVGGAINVFTSPSTTVQFNRFTHNYSDNLFVQDGSNNCTIADNTFDNLGGGVAVGADCIQFANGTECTGNLITRNLCDMSISDSPKGGVTLESFSGTVSYNRMIGGGSGVNLQSSCHDSTIAYNIISGQLLIGASTGASILSSGVGGTSANVTIHHNIVWGSVHGIYITNSPSATVRTNWKFYNNTVYNCSVHGDNLQGTIDGAFENNIVWASSARSGTFQMNGVTAFGAGGWVQDYNLFGPQATNFLFWTTGTSYATLAAWQAATGKDAHSITTDPKFVNP